LVFFTGHAGTGKTTLSKRAVPLLHARTGESFFLLDKDTAYGDYSAKVMKLLTGDPDDRDSPNFLRNLRDTEYGGLIDIARENLALGVNVLVCAPFSVETREKRLLDTQALGVPADTRMSAVWVTLAEDEARRRIVARAHPRDHYKLAHWDEYRVRRFEPTATAYPELILFDHTGFDEAAFAAVIDRLASGPTQA
jgi:predicted kinase